MRLSRDLVHNHSPEYRQALQELIKFELQALIERLSATGEEALILTASSSDGSLTQFGSAKAEGFLQKHSNLGTDFLTYCNDDPTQSSADELGTFVDVIKSSQKVDCKEGLQVSPLQYTTLRKRERTSSKRLSVTETQENPDNIYTAEVSQNSDISGFEKNDSASSVSSFVEAKEDRGSKSDLQCRICRRKFRSYRALNQHFRLHMAKSYRCGICGKIFSMKKSHQRHVKSHHTQERHFDCALCDKSFTNHYAFQRHREGHVSMRNYSCDLCGKAFYEKYSLRVHQTSHFNTQKIDKNVDTLSGYPCHICQKISKTKTALKNHMLTHSAKKHTCEFCNKRFSLKYSYVRHRRIHTGEKPYKCGSCDKSFSDGSAWNKHILTHSAIKPYSCTICSKSFFYKTACKTHMKSHQSKKNRQSETRNFQMISVSADEKEVEFEPAKLSAKKDEDVGRAFESDSESRMYAEEMNLQLEESDKEYEGPAMLDSSFGADMLPATSVDTEKKKKTDLISSVDLDEKFQTEFVERNMPIKGLESVNELISTAFPDDSELLAEDTETENQGEIQESLKEKPVSLSPLKQQLSRRVSRRSVIGKQLPELSTTKCRKCHKVFPQESALKQHLQFHCMMKLYKCRYCGKQLSTKHSLVRHERIHVGDRPYQCGICQKKFADNYSCIRHSKLHFTSDDKNVAAPTLSSRQHTLTLCTKPQAEIRRQSSVSVSENISGRATKWEEPDISGCASKWEEPIGSSHCEACPDIFTDRAAHSSPVETCSNMFADKQSTQQGYIKDDTYLTTSSYAQETKAFQKKENQDRFSEKRSSQQTYSDDETYQTTNTYCQTNQKYPDKETEQFTNQSAITKKSDNFNVKSTISSDSTSNYAFSSTDMHSTLINSDQILDRKQWFKCYACSNLFETQQKCVEHIQRSCGTKQSTSPVENSKLLTVCTKTVDRTELKSLFQCSLCSKMFDNESICQKHIQDDCLKSKASSECVGESILSETLQYSDLSESQETLPQLPFTELDSDQDFLSMGSENVMFLPDQYNCPDSVPATASVDTTLTVAGAESTKVSPGFIPVTQLASQGTSSNVQFCSSKQTAPQVQSSNMPFTGLVQKPVVNLGQNKFVVTNKGISLVSTSNVTNVTSPSVVKPERTGKKSETDISERTCTICTKVFTTKHILKQHLLIHMERKFECKYCMKKFHNKYGRDRHERIHTGEKPFSCPNCKRAFSDNSTYRKHTRVCCSGK